MTNLGITIGQVPDVPSHLEATRTIADLRHVHANARREDVVLKGADGLAGETCADEEKEGRRANEEPVERCRGSGLVD